MYSRTLETTLLSALFLAAVQSTYAGDGNVESGASISDSVPSPTVYVPATPSSVILSTPTPFPPVGSIPRNYSPSALEELWDLESLVGYVQPPPFTTTPVPSLPVILPSPPPALYPSFYAAAPADILPNYKFPEGFIFGMSTSAYQVEGAAKSEGKGPSIWDWASRQPGFIADNTTADVVTLQYYLYKEDAARIAALGVKLHSFSVSWARIYPFGVAGSPLNQQGLDHYSDLIDYHLSLGIDVAVTLFHWDLPLALAAYYGGFTSPQIVDDYVNYATTLFNAFNGRVKTWITFNEPTVYCSQILEYPLNTSFAPGVNISTATGQCSYYLLKAHAAAVKVFRASNISGEIGLKNNDFIGVPWRANSSDDALAVERHIAFTIGRFSDPIYATGNWPTILLETLPAEYFPRFTEEEQKDLLGSADFYAIDMYAALWNAAPPEGIAACVANASDPNWPECSLTMLYDSNAGWSAGPSPDPASETFLQAAPQNVRYYLSQLHARWPTNKIYITEFGFDDAYEVDRTEIWQITEDVDRTNYYMTTLGEVLLSIHEDGVPVMGAFCWAMIDNVEWNSGVSVKFGVQYVNLTTLERTYKRSAMALSQFYSTHLVSNATV